ncbi:non-specific lipid transfer protein-like 1 [Forsythia ovata]|uniref:Non-specific lipid transfer protein-like 1 n=1 Tax=Forsythia ovata TaxID=205694 RepID=A0ABD1PJJ7_9LAMI
MNETLTLIIRAILVSIHVLLLRGGSAAATPPLPSPPATCSDELVTFSLCLPYIASFPNNITGIPPLQCCDHVSIAFASGSALCLCYFVHRPGILGFPINSTKLMSLTSVCPENRHGSKANFSLESLCSGAGSPQPSMMGSPQESSDASIAPEPSNELPIQPSNSTTPATISYATKKIHSRIFPVIIFLVYVLQLHVLTPYDSSIGSIF